MKQAFHIPDELRTVLRGVAEKLDGDRAVPIEHECVKGGRIAGTGTYRLTYYARDGHARWELELGEQQIRDIAAGDLDEVEGDELEAGTRASRGEPLLVWGEFDNDALHVRSLAELGVALDALDAIGLAAACMIRLWSPSDDQIVAVVNGIECSLYVVSSAQGYGTSVGDPTRRESFEIVDHDVGSLLVLWSDCVPWRVARAALLHFAEHGNVGDHVILDGRIPSQLLMLGDYDRDAELQSRRAPPSDAALSSLPLKAPHGDWADRLLRGLIDLQLIELDTSILPAITARTAMLLVEMGADAQDSLENASMLGKQIAKVRGVGALFATAGDLQIAVRRTQDPPTMPVEMPFT